MKIVFATFLISLLGFHAPALADEEATTRARSDESARVIEGSFVYGSFAVHPHLIHRLADIDEDCDDDPFAAKDLKDKKTTNPTLDQIAPRVSTDTLPQCLPFGKSYRDLSKLANPLGVGLKNSEWLLLAHHGTRAARIFFCTTPQSADIIELLFHIPSPNSPQGISNLATLVSVDHQPLKDNKAWTMDRLTKLSPTIHSRYGLMTQSGHSAALQYTQDKEAISQYDIEPTLGENHLLVDLRLYFSANLTKQQAHIKLETTLTNIANQPFILDCGIHGKPQRNYLLIVQSRALKTKEKKNPLPRVSLKKIDGRYAFRTKLSPPQDTIQKTVTSSYLSNARFLPMLREYHTSHRYKNAPNTPSSGSPHALQPPARITGLKDNKHHSSKDVVYDITRHLQHLGGSLLSGEQIYLNETRKRIIIKGHPDSHRGILAFANVICPIPLMIRTQAQIVRVDRKGLDMPHWTPAAIASSNPTFLKKYCTTARSGEKSVFGQETSKTTHKNPKTGKDIVSYSYEFEAVTFLDQTSNSDTLSVQFTIDTPPHGTDKLPITFNSFQTILDGETTITELGHPNSATHTHLLILNADIITTDGSFYRDHFKALE